MGADQQDVTPPLSVAAALGLAPLDRGRVVAGVAGLASRAVRWVAVIEWPVEDFVAPGEFVLTTGLGCDEARFERLALEIAESGAAALCVSVGPGAPLAAVPAGVIALGDRLSLPVIEMPWRVRFADIARALVDRLLAARYKAEAEARVYGDFLWELASGELDRPVLAAKATLLGYPLGERYHVLLAHCAENEPVLDELVRQVQRRGATGKLLASHRGDLALVLIPAAAPPLPHPAALAERVAQQLPPQAVSWGVAEGTFELLDLADGVRQARRVLDVGRALRGPGHVVAAGGLEPFLMLGGLAVDPGARQMAQALLAPLLRHDGGDLLRTLEVYLEENGNTSSAARRLFLNRHSLMYRLRKIESLTGRDLASHEDRFALEMSVRLHRLYIPGHGD